MRLTRLRLSNWMLFDSVSVDLPGGAIAVVGRYADDVQRSNWSGKTSLLESIEWALYGVHRKRYDDDVIRKGEHRCTVTLNLDGVEIQRSRRRGKASVLRVVDGDGECFGKAAQARIVELLGMDHADFRATLCVAQDDTLAIVSRTSSERRKLIAQWLELDSWQRAQARVVSARNDTRKRLEATRLSIEHIQSRIADRGDVQSDFDVVQALVESTRKDADGCQAELMNSIFQQTAWDAKAACVRLSEETIELAASIRRQVGESADGTQSANREAQLESDLSRLRTELEGARDLERGEFDGQCPLTCGQCPVADHVIASREALNARVETITSEIGKADRELREHSTAAREQSAKQRDLIRTRERYNMAAQRLREAKELAKGAPTREPDVATLRERSGAAAGKWRDAVSRLAEIKASKAALETDAELLLSHEAQIGAHSSDLRVQNIAVNALSPSGIPADIARDSLDDLEDRANMLLRSCGLSFAFAWDRQARGLADACNECGYPYRGQREKSCPLRSCGVDRAPKMASELEILVDDGTGLIEDVRYKSGGAQVLVASAIRLSAGAMLRELRGSTIAFALVDEPFGALDARNRNELAMTFAAMLGMVGLEQAFVVSHDVALLDALPSGIDVVRNGDVSKANLR